MIQVHDLKFQKYLSTSTLQVRIAELAADLQKHYSDKQPLFLGVLNGAFMFASDLLKVCTFDCEISFIKLASYQGTASTGEVRTMIGLDKKLQGRHLIIIEDIVDTGNTMAKLLHDLSTYRPASVAVVTLLLKPAALQHPQLPLDYVGFEIDNQFVVGYGLDYDGFGRNYPDLYQLVQP
ncbi:MAG: hypoxanthine phosphoribosyltransferase [Bacteroidota bacterium]